LGSRRGILFGRYARREVRGRAGFKSMISFGLKDSDRESRREMLDEKEIRT